MRIKLNTIFFSCFFTAVLLAELYCLLVLKADLFTIVGLGVVILISLYLLMDSIRSQWKKGKEKTLLYLEQLYREEAEKQDQRFTELLNLQKASYTSAKKNTARLEEKLEELLLKLYSLEQSNIEELKRVAEYQKKLMEGQKNSLNIEVNYNKENTKAIIATIREEAERLNQEDRLEQLLKAFEGLQGISSRIQTEDYLSEVTEEEIRDEEFAEALSVTDTNGFLEDDLTEEVFPEETPTSNVIPLYEDPNKSLTADEIAALFASYGQ